MAALREIARRNAEEIRDGIAWVIVWRNGRSWDAEPFWLDFADGEPDREVFTEDDLPRVREIMAEDPGAVMLNGYYCGHFGEGMTVDELALGIRWHYENGFNRVADSDALPEDEPEAEAAEAPETGAEYTLEAVSAAFMRMGEAFNKLGSTADSTAYRIATSALTSVRDMMLYYVAPKWWHMAHHAKKKRVRKKYQNKLRKYGEPLLARPPGWRPEE